MNRKEIYEEMIWHLVHGDKYSIEIVSTAKEKKLIKAEISRSSLSGLHIANAVSKRIENLEETQKKLFLPFEISKFICYISGNSNESLDAYKLRKKKEKEIEKKRVIERKKLKELPDYYTEFEAEKITEIMIKMLTISNCLCEDDKEDIIYSILKSRVSMKRVLYGLATRLKKGTIAISLVKYINYLNRIKSETLIAPDEKSTLDELYKVLSEFD